MNPTHPQAGPTTVATRTQPQPLSRQPLAAMSRELIEDQVAAVRNIQQHIMRDGEHYGTVPGVSKPFLWKTGAELLCMAFNLRVEYATVTERLDDDFISYTKVCNLTSRATGELFATGEGSCNSREKKYRNFKSNVYDGQNTFLKMANKRALVAATLNAFAATNAFNPDSNDWDSRASKAPAPKRDDPRDVAGLRRSARAILPDMPDEHRAQAELDLEGACSLVDLERIIRDMEAAISSNPSAAEARSSAPSDGELPF